MRHRKLTTSAKKLTSVGMKMSTFGGEIDHYK